MLKINNRLISLPEYQLGKLDKIKENLLSQGKEVLDLGVGDPDLLTDNTIIEGLKKSLTYKGYNNYPPYAGIKELKDGIIKYYKDVFGVTLDREEVLVLIGSKEGISNLIPALCDTGDYAIIPKPSYPVYDLAAKLWGAVSYKIPLKEKDEYLPDLSAIPNEIINKSKMFLINYPNNPTGAVANPYFFKEIIEFCYKNNIVLCNDGAYNEIIRGTEAPLSLLQFDYQKKFIEFGSFSKIFSMSGFRLGYVVGNREVLNAILKIKMNMDSGQFVPVQWAGVEALKLGRDYVNGVRKIYDERIELAENKLKECDIKFFKSKGAFYIWATVPKQYTTDEFCEELLNKCGIIVTPGYVFGNLCHGYFRMSLTKDKMELEKGLSKLNNLNK
ncbi:aminotransferase class I/II-fold pyridoxal phosphate-dependent enzyme [Clostridium peptidivorans]|uniref:aminotransferase class I/II-fold pyridoxal phosphate-dependent enzyme n=1 Tax=Clostridium peptidivorans TaxID=100174 RepID=UPI000BE2F86C|nr:aminotransferase class I/II-fold pyridoxal phosphate-dependent enzyme [Clostridium peptidivorans]